MGYNNSGINKFTYVYYLTLCKLSKAMSHFNGRHPPMGSEKGIDNQTVFNIDDKVEICHSSSSSSDELDELSLRVQALLSETVDDLSSFHQEHQQIMSSEYDHLETHVKVSYSLELKHTQPTELKLSPGQRDEDIYSEHSVKDLTSSDEVYVDSYVEDFEIPEKETEPDALNTSDGVLQSLFSSCKTYEQDISKYSLYDSVCDTLEKHISSSSSQQNHHAEVSTFVNKKSSCTTHCPCFLTSSKGSEEQLSACNVSDCSVLPAAVLTFHPCSDKDAKEFLWAKYGDYDTPPLSASSVASSKRLEWDNAADIGYAVDIGNNAFTCRKNRRGPEGYPMKTEIQNVPSQHAALLNNQFSVKKDLNKLEETEQSQISYPSDDILDMNQSKISDKSKDFKAKSCDNHNKSNLLFDNEIPCFISMNLDSTLKECKVQMPDLSVRPKDKIHVQRSLPSGESPVHKKTIGVETEVVFLKSDEIRLEENKTKQDKNGNNSRDADMKKKKVSFMQGSNYINTDHGQTEMLYSEQQLFHPFQTLPSSVEYYSQIISSPVFIDSDVLTSQDIYGKPADDNAISNPEGYPHIRWYPLPAYKNSQDIKNASSQTSMPFHCEQMSESPESFDNTDMELSLCDDTISIDTQTQTNENFRRDVNETTHITVGSYPHVIENLSYENVVLSIQRNTNEIFPPLINRTFDCQSETEKDNKEANAYYTLSEIKGIIERGFKNIRASDMEGKGQENVPSSSPAYVILFSSGNKINVVQDVHTPLLNIQVPDRFKNLGHYQAGELKKFCKKKKFVIETMKQSLHAKEESRKTFIMENMKRKKKFSKVLLKEVSFGKTSFCQDETVLPVTSSS